MDAFAGTLISPRPHEPQQAVIDPEQCVEQARNTEFKLRKTAILKVLLLVISSVFLFSIDVDAATNTTRFKIKRSATTRSSQNTRKHRCIQAAFWTHSYAFGCILDHPACIQVFRHEIVCVGPRRRCRAASTNPGPTTPFKILN